MLPRLAPTRNDLGRSVSDGVPAATPDLGLHRLPPAHGAIWDASSHYLARRDNDVHTIYSYGLARALVDLHPECDPEIVLPAILLHDSGWSQVPLDEIMQALVPGYAANETIRRHEIEGARIAREILENLGHAPADVDEIVEIIDGHDTRKHSLSLNDSLVRDADKLWRITPRRVDTVMDWFGLDRDESLRLNSSRVFGHLFTDAARTMARALAAVGWVDTSPERVALDPTRR